MLSKPPEDDLDRAAPHTPPEPPRPSGWMGRFLAAERWLSRHAWQLTRFYTGIDTRTQGLPGHLIQRWTDFNQRDTRYAASLAYYAVFSIFPLLLLTVSLLSGIVGPALAQEQILNLVGNFFPAETLELIAENVNMALQQRESFGLVAVIGLVWSGLSLFSNLTVAIDNIFQPKVWRPMWHKRLLALVMTIVLAMLLLVSLLTSVTLRFISILMLDRPSTILSIVTLFLPLGLNMTIFALLFRHVPRVHVRWDAIWPAALLGGIGWDLVQRLFVWFVDNFAAFNVIYGSLGAVIVLLVWVYVSAVILLLSAELCAALNSWAEEREKRRRQQ